MASAHLKNLYGFAIEIAIENIDQNEKEKTISS